MKKAARKDAYSLSSIEPGTMAPGIAETNPEKKRPTMTPAILGVAAIITQKPQ